MEQVKKHIGILGMKAKDRVTGYKGVVTSVSFDLYGCIQAVITPEQNGAEYQSGCWFDVRRLDIGKKRVMDVPDYTSGYIAEGRKGPAEKPLP
jgi:hypothetical protein